MLTGYLLLSVSLFGAVVKGYFGKKTSQFVEKTIDTVFLNSVRMVMCVIIGLLLIILQGNFRGILTVSPITLVISLCSGVTMAVFLITWLLAVRTGAFMLISVFTNAGLIVPLVLSSILFGEEIRVIQWFGVAILLYAVYLIMGYSNSIKGKLSLKAFILLVICSLSSGFNDFFVGKAFSTSGSDDSKAVFTLYSYVFCALFLMLLYVFYSLKERKLILKEHVTRFKPVYIYIAILSVCLFLNSYFKTAAGEYLTSIQLYPVNVGACILLSTLTASIGFKEVPNKRCIVGLLLNFASLIVINILPQYIKF